MNPARASAIGVAAEKDPWLSAQLGRPALRVRVVAGVGDPSLPRRLREQRLFATGKLGMEQVSESIHLQGLGFRVIDTSLSFEAPAAPLHCGDVAGVRMALPDDEAAVRDIAGRAFRYSRFHLDPAIPPSTAARLKAEWAGNYFRGARGDAMLVAERDGAVAGFLLALHGHRRATIDLIAVAPEQAVRGVGQALVRGLARSPVDAASPVSISVGTQAANLAAMRFYQRLDFQLVGASYVLHHHGGKPDHAEEDGW